MRRVVLAVLITQWAFMVVIPCTGGDTKDDLTAIRELLLNFEQGYEERDVEKYVSVFSDREYEYISDMTTPDDPSDDIRLLGAESERRATIRIFKAYENIDLEVTGPQITIDGDSAKAKNEIRILFVAFESYYAASSNTFSLKKIKGEWRIVRWQQHELSKEELAARNYEERKDKKVVDLIRDLGDNRLRIWTAAIVELRKARETAIPLLIEALRNPSKNVRTRAAKVLCGTRNEDAIRALMEILENEKDDVDVRVAAASALSEYDNDKVDRSLIVSAKGNEPKLKAAASIALARRIKKKMDDVYGIAVTGLQHEDEAVRKTAAESLGIITSVNGMDLLEQRFKDRSESESVRLAVVESLKQLRSESLLPFLRDALKDKTEAVQIRAYAARTLAEAKDPQAMELLIDIAKNEKETFELRKDAIAGLGATDNSKATKPLISLLKSSDVDLRREAIKSLERLGDRRALKPLIMVLMNRDEDIFVRRLAGGGIVKIDRDIAFGPLAQIINDETESAPARRMAAEMIASSGDDRSVPLFKELLGNEQRPWWLRRVVTDCLGKVATPPCVGILKTAAGDADVRIARAAQDVLKKIDTRASFNP